MTSNRKTINLYNDKNIKSFKTVFNITNDNDLNDFWFYFEESEIYKNTKVFDYSTEIFNIISFVLKKCTKGFFFDIIFEKSDKFAYFTIWNNYITNLFLEDKRVKNLEYANNQEKISFKIALSDENINFKTFEKEKTHKDKEIPHIDTKLSKVQIENREKVIFNFIDGKDLTSLYDCLDDLVALFIDNETKLLDENLLLRATSDFSELATTLSFYEELYVVYGLLSEFSSFLTTNKNTLLSSKINLFHLFEALINDLIKWLDSLFKFGTVSIDFLDASIKANIETIKNFAFDTQEHSHSSVDDIFDFYDA